MSLSIPENRTPAFLRAVNGRTPAPRELLPPARILLVRLGSDRVDLKVAELSCLMIEGGAVDARGMLTLPAGV